MATKKAAAKSSAKKSPKKSRKPAESRGPSESDIAVLKQLKKMGATSALNAVEADKVIEKMKDAEFSVGDALYKLRHLDPPLTARADIEGQRKSTYLTRSGLAAIGS